MQSSEWQAKLSDMVTTYGHPLTEDEARYDEVKAEVN